MLVLRILDLLLFTDPATGFVETGWFGLRILLPAAVAVLAYPHGAARCAPPAGAARRLPAAWRRAAWRRGGDGGGLPAGTAGRRLNGVDFGGDRPASARYGALCTARGLSARWPTPLPGCLVQFGRCPALAFVFWCGIYRFAVAPASVVRLGYTLRVLSAVAALLFLVVLFRVFFTPGLPVGRSLYATGCNAFLFCTCHELPQAVFGQLYGRVTLAELAASLAFGLAGGCGAGLRLVCFGRRRAAAGRYQTGQNNHLRLEDTANKNSLRLSKSIKTSPSADMRRRRRHRQGNFAANCVRGACAPRCAICRKILSKGFSKGEIDALGEAGLRPKSRACGPVGLRHAAAAAVRGCCPFCSVSSFSTR